MKETIEMIKYLFSDEGNMEVKRSFKLHLLSMVYSTIALVVSIYVFLKTI